MGFFNKLRRYRDYIGRLLSYRPVLKEAVDFDYASILAVEKLQITRVRDCVARFRNHVGWEQDVADMDLALRLLEIIESGGEAERLGSEPEFVKAGNGLWEIKAPDDWSWRLDRYVNINNASRFQKGWNRETFSDPRMGDLYKDKLRVEKAWCLYHKLRQYKLRRWWD